MSLGKFSEVDAATRGRIDAACNFINHKVEQLRKRVLTVFAVSFVLALIVWVATWMDPRMPFMGALLVSMLVMGHANRELKRWHKQMLVPRVVQAVGKGLTYSRDSSLGEEQFRNMDLYDSRIDVWKSEDQICGTRDNIDFTLHEVRAARREKRGKHTREVVFFQGHVVVLEFNKHFSGHTIVVADSEAQLLGGLFGQTESRRRKRLVSFANVEFEQRYAVYATDDQEAHYLLTPKLMELVLKAGARFGSDMRLAFYDTCLFVTVPSEQDRFEVQLFGQKVSPYTVISELAAVVELAHQLIDALDLETRIWTRA